MTWTTEELRIQFHRNKYSRIIPYVSFRHIVEKQSYIFKK